MKKITKTLLALLMALSFSACSSSTSESATSTATATSSATSFTAGTYTGTGTGHGGNITVSVTLSDTAIESIEVTEMSETSGFGDVAAEHIISDVLENQSLDIDNVTGCTVSTAGIRTAIYSAISSSGADVNTLADVEKKTVDATDETIDTDVVVVGSGAAGLTAAYEAASAGSNVIIVEKLARNGGATRTSSGMIVAGGTSLQEEAGIEDSVQNLKDYWMERGEGEVNEEFVNFVAENINDALDLFMDLGVSYSSSLILQSGTATVNRAHMPSGSGAELCDRLVEAVEELGVQIYTETDAESLLQDSEGNVTGVSCTTKTGTLTVNAKSVVLATGGYGASSEMLAEHSPNAVGAWSCSAPGNDGSGINMAEAIGADTTYKGGFIGWKVCTPAYDHTTAIGAPVYGSANLIVNENGQRVGDESQDYPFVYNDWEEDGSENFYYIFQAGNSETKDLVNNVSDTVANLELGVEASVVYKADTLEELAEVSGLTDLVSTVETFNAAIDAGEDTEFGRDTSTMTKIENGPYYAIHAERAILGTFGGLKTQVTGEVLNTEGATINGLYAAGECANGEFFPVIYPASGSSISQCVTLGREAGKSAAAYASK